MKIFLVALTFLISSISLADNCVLIALNASQRNVFAQFGYTPGFQNGCLVVQQDNNIIYEWTGTTYVQVGGPSIVIPSGAAGGIIYYTGPLSLASLPAGTSGQVLTSNGSGAPTWNTAGGGGITWSTPVDSSIIPDTTATYNLGSSAEMFLNGYITELHDNSNLIAYDVNNRVFYSPNGQARFETKNAFVQIDAGVPLQNEANFDLTIKTQDQSGLGSGGINLNTGNTDQTSGDIQLLIGAGTISRGSIKFQDGSEGSIGQIWTSKDVNGQGNWVTPPDYSARAFSSTTTISSSAATIVYATEDFDASNSYDNTTGIYTVPADGKYQVNAALRISGTMAVNNTITMSILVDGAVISEKVITLAAALTSESISISDIIIVTAGDDIRIQVATTATSPSIASSNTRNYLSLSRAP